MDKKNLKSNTGIILGICVIFLLASSNAFARNESRQRSFGQGRDHSRRHYDRFSRPGGLSFSISFGNPRAGGIIKVLPPRHRVVIVRGVRYYYYNDIYYTACPLGYVVVPAPINPNTVMPFGVPSQASNGEVVVVNVPNAGGGYVSVTLIKYRDGYIGPQGEFYVGHPTVQQLTALYGQ